MTGGLLGSLYSTIDSTKRKYGGLLADFVRDPVTTAKLHMTNVGNAASEQQALLDALYRDDAGKITMNPAKWSMASKAAHEAMTQNALGAVAGATVYHGSPHVFNKFDSTKIGTGEGAQVYGHGLYLADSPAVAQHYSSAGDGSAHIVKNWLMEASDAGLSGEPAKQWARQKIAERAETATGPAVKRRFADAYERFDELLNLGNVYKVDLPDQHIAKMLDYDNAVPETVRQPLSKAALDKFGSGISMGNGEQMMRQIASEFRSQGHPSPNAAASEWLSSQGVPGLRYLDGMSREKGGTSNYVVFPGNEDILKILSRNGKNLLDFEP